MDAPEEIQQHLRDSLHKFDAAVEAMQHRRISEAPSTASGNTATFNVNAGGIGVWFCSAIALALLVGFFVGGFWVSRELARIDEAMTRQADVDSVQDAYIHKLRAEQTKGN